MPASSVANVVAAISANQEQEVRRNSLVLKVSDDGQLRARIPSTTRHTTLSLTGQLGTRRRLRDVARRGCASRPALVLVLWTYLTLAMLFLLLAVIQVCPPGARRYRLRLLRCPPRPDWVLARAITRRWLLQGLRKADGGGHFGAAHRAPARPRFHQGHSQRSTEAGRVLTWITRFGRPDRRPNQQP